MVTDPDNRMWERALYIAVGSVAITLGFGAWWALGGANIEPGSTAQTQISSGIPEATLGEQQPGLLSGSTPEPVLDRLEPRTMPDEAEPVEETATVEETRATSTDTARMPQAAPMRTVREPDFERQVPPVTVEAEPGPPPEPAAAPSPVPPASTVGLGGANSQR